MCLSKNGEVSRFYHIWALKQRKSDNCLRKNLPKDFLIYFSAIAYQRSTQFCKEK